ncbi:MAG: hypothetical protein IJE01_05175 [Clostridia bacterium]|nr:hypothetical protein [Clostridia bacterium]
MVNCYFMNSNNMCDAFCAPSAFFCPNNTVNIEAILSTAVTAVLLFISRLRIIIRNIIIIKNKFKAKHIL